MEAAEKDEGDAAGGGVGSGEEGDRKMQTGRKVQRQMGQGGAER